MAAGTFEFEVTFEVALPGGEACEEVRVMGGYPTERAAEASMRRMVKAWTGADPGLTVTGTAVRRER